MDQHSRNTLETGANANFCITLNAIGEYVGQIDLRIDGRHNSAEIGYLIAKWHWNQGYCTEALRAVIDWGFDTLRLNRIHAGHFANNPASGRVMRTAGMQLEGTWRQRYRKGDVYLDSIEHAITLTDPRP